MRIVNREEFLKLPIETVYCKYSTLGNFEEVQIKSATYTTDWRYQNLFDVDAPDSNVRTELLLDAEEKGTPLKLHFESTYRDGFFDQDQLFAIFDKDEIREMIGRLTVAWKAQP